MVSLSVNGVCGVFVFVIIVCQMYNDTFMSTLGMEPFKYWTKMERKLKEICVKSKWAREREKKNYEKWFNFDVCAGERTLVGMLFRSFIHRSTHQMPANLVFSDLICEIRRKSQQPWKWILTWKRACRSFFPFAAQNFFFGVGLCIQRRS